MEGEEREKRVRTKFRLIITENRKGLGKPLGTMHHDIKKMLVVQAAGSQDTEQLWFGDSGLSCREGSSAPAWGWTDWPLFLT